MLEIFGYLGALLMGVTLGLIGGGGSILTLPLLVYIFQIETVLATTYSLFIVGLTALIGSFSHIKLGNIDAKVAIIFGIPSLISVFATRFYIVPLIPKTLGFFGSFEVTKSVFILVLLAILMLLAAYSMLRKSKNIEQIDEAISYNYPLIIVEGLLVGGVTAIVGAGGGFLIIPALVLLTKVPMKKAVGTSLIIIAAKSLIGFLTDLNLNQAINWPFLMQFSIVAIVGILIGSQLSKRFNNEKLKPIFAMFLIVMAIYVICKELFFK